MNLFFLWNADRKFYTERNACFKGRSRIRLQNLHFCSICPLIKTLQIFCQQFPICVLKGKMKYSKLICGSSKHLYVQCILSVYQTQCITLSPYHILSFRIKTEPDTAERMQHITVLAQKPDICRCISSNHDRLGFYAGIPFTSGTV